MNPASCPSHSRAIPPPHPATTASFSLSSTLASFSNFQDSCKKQLAESKRFRDSLESIKQAHKIQLQPIAQPLLNIQKKLNDCQSRVLDYTPEQIGKDSNEEKEALILTWWEEVGSLNALEPELQCYNWL